MRFSLLTLILASVLIGSLIGMYLRREPWVRDLSLTQEEANRLAEESIARKAMQTSLKDALLGESRIADGRTISMAAWDFSPIRQARIDDQHGRFLLALQCENQNLVEHDRWDTFFGDHPNALTARFLDADTVAIGALSLHGIFLYPPYDVKPFSMNRCHIFRRLYPEYWWGHLCRVEVWAAALSGAGLVAMGVKHWRRKGQKHANILQN